MGIEKEKIFEIIRPIYKDFSIYEHRNQLSIIVIPEKLKEVCLALFDNSETSFDMLLDITAIDRLISDNRFEIVYFLYSNKFKSRLRIKVPLDGDYPTCPSVTDIWESANWYERETYDMYGINFDGHPNLIRFYMPEDYVDPETGEPIYPLRKDFPLMGIPDSLPLPLYPEKYSNDN